MDIDALFKRKIEEISSDNLDDEWMSDPPKFVDYIGSGLYIPKLELSEKQLDTVLTVLGEDPKEIFSPQRVISLGVLCVGKGGGKDWLIALIMSYVIVVLLHLKSPQRFLQLNGHLDLLIVAIKKEQAKRIFFDYFTRNIKENKWILRNYKIYIEGKLLDASKKYVKNLGTIKIGDGNAIFPKDIRVFAESSDNESWEGYNVIFFALDEISGFISEKGYATGRRIYETATSSCISRRTKNFKGVGFVLSYPRQEKNDIIVELYLESRKPKNPHIYGVFAFSWQFLPKFRYEQEFFEFANPRINKFFGYPENQLVGISIPKYLESEFIENPEGSLTKYCCLPPRLAGDWIEYPERIYSAINYNLKPLFETEDRLEERVLDGKTFTYLSKKIVRCNELDINKRKKDVWVAWLDSAEKNCDAVICIGRKSYRWVEDKETNGKQLVEIVQIVDVINWTPVPERGVIIDLVNVEDFLTTEIRKYINLKIVGCDYWNTATLTNKLTKVGINPIPYNLVGNHYEVGKELFYKGQVEIFDEEPFINKVRKEMTSLEQMTSLTAVAKGVEKKSGLRKDKSDGVIGVINLVLGNLFTDKQKQTIRNNGKFPAPIKMHGGSQSMIPKLNLNGNSEVVEFSQMNEEPEIKTFSAPVKRL